MIVLAVICSENVAVTGLVTATSVAFAAGALVTTVGLIVSGATVVNDQVTDAARALPAWSATPVVTVAV